MKAVKKSVCAVLILLVAQIFLPAFTVKPANANAVSLNGAWGYGTAENRTVLIFSGNVFAVANYDVPGKKMISSYGGTWQLDGNKLVRKIEWNSKDSMQVGTEISGDIKLAGTSLSINPSKEKWERLDDGGPGELAGVWVITGNYTNDKVSKRGSPFYPRRTMKVLSGKYFHWIAYNVATKQFLNAGGGSYTTANGKYTENIEFFTKTAESVGKSLVFDYSFVDGDWRHRGQKSTGGAMDECWTKRELLEKK